MDLTLMTPFLVQALGGLVAGNILGAVVRGGGGAMGRSLVGIVGGLAAGWAAQEFAPTLVGDLRSLSSSPEGAHLGDLIIGAAGGGGLGLIAGLLLRPRA